MNYTDDFINLNNDRILSVYAIQARYKPDFPCRPQAEQTRKKEQSEQASKRGTSANENIKRLLMAVNLSQFDKTLTETCQVAGFSLGTGSRVSKQAEQQGLIKTIQANLGRGNPRYPVLTEAGYEYLGIQQASFYGRGAGLEHILYQHLIAAHLSEAKPKIEANIKGKFVDVAIQDKESLVCIEIEITSAHIRQNLEKDFGLAGAQSVIVACVDSKVKAKANEILSSLSDGIRSRTRVILVSELLNSDPGRIMDELRSDGIPERKT